MKPNKARTVLGLSQKAPLDDEDIKNAFREKSKEYHPDTSDLPNAREKFLEIKEARKVLLAADTRKSRQSSSTTNSSGSTGTTRDKNHSSTNSTSTSSSSSSGKSSSTSSHTGTNNSSSSGSSTSNGNSSYGGSSSSESERTTSSRSRKRTTTSTKSATTGKENWRSRRTSRTHGRSDRTRKSESSASTTGETTESAENDSGTATGSGTGGHRQTDSGPTAQSQRTWTTITENISFNTHEAGGYLGIGVFPVRPPGRSRIIHLFAILVGCVSLALFSRGQYNAVAEANATPGIIQPKAYFYTAFVTPTLLPIISISFKLRHLWRFLLLPRGGGAILGGAMVPVAIHGWVTSLTVPTATGAGVLGAGVLMGVVSLGRYTALIKEAPTVDEWAQDRVSGMTWAPGGILVLLGVHTLFYLVARENPMLYYGSLKFYLILLAPAIAITAILHRTKPSLRDITPAITLALIFAIGICVHLPWFEPIMPGYLLPSSGYYSAASGVRFDGVIYTIWAVSWHLLFAALVDVLLLGWDMAWHKLPSKQIVPYTVWSSLIGGGIGAVIWAVWPTYQAPVVFHSAHQYLIAGAALFTYVYGVVTEPVAG